MHAQYAQGRFIMKMTLIRALTVAGLLAASAAAHASPLTEFFRSIWG
jgi:hypothetical protein